ncbi:RNA polymerase sigma factor [Modestobacter versicolor]|uniref:RNA polymerase sigma factor (Sigma-70 family) n=1 Tax=Modestobacter versicolor TaxID=429133 RepID=A0A839Y3Q8_9ACTN|nr:sigma-70 family RNA polymerase sigma factor [Modestobacter versicolor]MBB3674403.1 RNA polymerase sigma factor (sigma-70 family) [Modestobacter versicolor]
MQTAPDPPPRAAWLVTAPEVSTADLVRAAATGDRGAWDTLVGRYAGLVWSVARGHRLQGEDAADVFQTTWLRLVEQLPRIREPERVGAWLATTARRECLRVLRRSGRETVSRAEVLEAVPDDVPGFDESLVRAEQREALWHHLQTSSDRCRRLLRVLVADPPLSYTEVAEVLEMPIGSIGPTRRRCLEQLRRRLEEAGVDVDL